MSENKQNNSKTVKKKQNKTAANKADAVKNDRKSAVAADKKKAKGNVQKRRTREKVLQRRRLMHNRLKLLFSADLMRSVKISLFLSIRMIFSSSTADLPSRMRICPVLIL